MKLKIIIGIMVALLFGSILTVASRAFLTVEESSSSTTIYVEPPVVDATVYTNFTVEVKVRDVVDLYGYTFHLYWDCNLSCIEWTPTPPWTHFIIGKNECNNPGKYYWCTVITFEPVPSFTGNTTLAILTFHCEGVGSCALSLEQTSLADRNINPIPHNVENGVVHQYKFGDLDGDGDVDVDDLYVLARDYGKTEGP